MLSVHDLTVRYEGVTALSHVSIEAREGEIVAIIGANGAGKSTLLRSVMGLVKPSSGQVSFLGRRLDGLTTEAIVGLGLSLVPETRELFSGMSCRDNLRTGLIKDGRDRLYDVRATAVWELFPRLAERQGQRAGTRSGGEQQMLAIGRALMQQPRLLLLDEPSLGLSPNLTLQLFEKIAEIRRSGRTVVVVEQKARLALEIADRAYVLTVGSVARSGNASELRRDEAIRRLYFGEPVETDGDLASNAVSEAVSSTTPTTEGPKEK